MIAHTIQLALTPVFVLVAIGNILSILSGRLSRIVDRVRLLQQLHPATDGPEHDRIVAQMRALDRRIHLNTQAHFSLVASGLAVGATVAALFVEEILGYALDQLVAGTFLLAVALLMWALTLFLRETRVAAATLRVHEEYLEHHRDL